ncbi:MAG TPA: serine hydrolase domain-containing protein [Vicinamibacterales bacterium]|nr:serine hydrolase domain-containing protein [Vicinamibacterales bacterium]
MTRTRMLVLLVAVALLAPAASAQEVVRKEAPPEIRTLFQALAQGANGDAAGWESFAQAHFSASLLKQQTAEQRAALHKQIADRFGSITINGVRREGPDAPLQVIVKGSKADGEIRVELDGGSPKIFSINVDGGGALALSSVAPGAKEGAPSQAGPAARGGASSGPNALPPVPIDRSLSSDEIDRRLTDYFEKLAAGEVFSGVALVARNGVPVFMKAYGLANRDQKIANTVRTRFNIGSINKVFTQIAIRQLIAEGKLSPTDTVGKFFPDYPQAVTRSATIEQLLTHRAGVSDFFGPQFNSAPKNQFASNADYFKFVGSLPPTFAPGERNQYCNGCYITLGAIVEKVSGMPYEKYVADRVFDRAEMTSTGYPRSDHPAPDLAIGYTRRGGDGTLRANTAMHGVAGSAAGGGYSTALDLLTFVKAVKAGKFSGTNQDLGIAGGAPGTNAIVESRGEWTVIVLTNFDPPVGQQLGVMIADALDRK